MSFQVWDFWSTTGSMSLRAEAQLGRIVLNPGLTACRRSFSGGASPGLWKLQIIRALAQNLIKDSYSVGQYEDKIIISN